MRSHCRRQGGAAVVDEIVQLRYAVLRCISGGGNHLVFSIDIPGVVCVYGRHGLFRRVHAPVIGHLVVVASCALHRRDGDIPADVRDAQLDDLLRCELARDHQPKLFRRRRRGAGVLVHLRGVTGVDRSTVHGGPHENDVHGAAAVAKSHSFILLIPSPRWPLLLLTPQLKKERGA